MEALIALIALTVMEIVLGIDNIVFISVQTSKLPPHQRSLARLLGLGMAMGMRILLLLGIQYIMRLTTVAFDLDHIGIPANWFPEKHREEIHNVSWKDLILLGGGLFLIYSSVREIHHKMEGAMEEHEQGQSQQVTLTSIVLQIGILDIIFSLDSVITAVGMAKDLNVMIAAIVTAVLVMMFFAGSISTFVEQHPTVKMLALSFLLLIGVMLVADGLGTHIDKAYIYFAMGFSLMVELFNLRAKRKTPEPKVVHPL
jgi:predicted tellurium resistance membrane protein TerC